MEQEPIMCKEKYHENEAVQYYCKVCNICICHKCSIVSHNGHAIEDIQRAAEKEKVKMAQVFAKVESQLDVVEARIMRQNEMMEESNEELCAAEDKVTRTVQEIIRIVKEREKAVKAKLTEIKVTQQKMYEAKLDAFQLHAAQLRSCLKFGKSIEKRNSGPEILEGKHDVFGRCEELLTAQDIEIYKPQHVSHFVNADTMNTVEHLVQVIESYTDPSQSSVEGNGLKEAEMGNETDLTVITRDSDGNQRYNEEDRVTVKIRLPKGQNEEMKIEDLQNGKYAVRYKPKSVGLHDIDVEVNGKPLTGSPWRVLVTGHQYKALHSFGSPGEGPGEFNRPDSIVVSERTGNIAIADNGNGRVQLFDSAWKYKRTIGNKGPGAERIRNPRSVAFTASGDVLVIHEEHSQRNKMSLFAENGQFIKNISQQLIDPQRASVRGDGHMIVCDSGDKSVKVLSSDGTRLVQSFRASACDQAPWYAVYHNDKFFVSYASANCVKVFNKGGEFQYDIGEEGSGDGQLKRPAGLAIDNFNNLIVCDSLNRRLQVFSLDGKFVFSFNEGIQFPCSIAVTKESKVVVSDIYKDIIHVFR